VLMRITCIDEEGCHANRGAVQTDTDNHQNEREQPRGQGAKGWPQLKSGQSLDLVDYSGCGRARRPGTNYDN
jgi:hypothetical protein